MPHRTTIRAAALLAVFAGSSSVVMAGPPRIVNIGVPPGATSSAADAVSADGSFVAAGSSAGSFRWSAPGNWDLIGSGGITGMSADGEIVIGYESGFEYARGFRWTPGGGRELLTGSSQPVNTVAMGLTADGQIIVGGQSTSSTNPDSPVRWMPKGLNTLSGIPQNAVARAVSHDGSVIVGGRFPFGYIAWRWTPAGVTLLPIFPSSVCSAHAISGDGEVIGGTCMTPEGPLPVRWTAAGIEALPRLAGFQEHTIYSFTADGAIAVGEAGAQLAARAAMWTSAGVVNLNDYLPSIGINLDGWVLTSARAITPAGDIIVGRGTFNAQHRGWIVYLPSCYANCDHSTTPPILNIEDFTCFINEFAAALALPPAQQISHYANCDHSTTPPVLNVDDFTCFINSFAKGCP